MDQRKLVEKLVELVIATFIHNALIQLHKFILREDSCVSSIFMTLALLKAKYSETFFLFEKHL